MKNPFKKKNKYPTPQAPRTSEEIKKEFFELSQKAGVTQYQAHVAKLELDRLNRRLVELNTENYERQQLDKAAAEDLKNAPKKEA